MSKQPDRLVLEKIKRVFRKNKDILSLYVYGSILTKYYKPLTSDIDILIIVKDTTNPTHTITTIKKASNNLADIRLDTNVVFYSEFIRRWHIYRPPTYYLGIKMANILLIGEDLLKQVQNKEITGEIIFKRATDLAQSSRSIYVNNKNDSFWESKYIKWLRVLSLEVLYLYGKFDLNFDTGIKKLISVNPSFTYLRQLKKKRLSIKEINNISEKIRNYILLNFIDDANYR